MKKDTLKNILDFLLEKENMDKPFRWKLVNNEPLTKEELTIKGDLFLPDSDITSLPEGFKVGNSLNLMNCKNLISLPKGLKVGGYLDLGNCTSLTYLPEGLKIGAFLNIRNTKLAKYSDDELKDMIKPNGYIQLSIFR
jgi:hypothetical protein